MPSSKNMMLPKRYSDQSITLSNHGRAVYSTHGSLMINSLTILYFKTSRSILIARDSTTKLMLDQSSLFSESCQVLWLLHLKLGLIHKSKITDGGHDLKAAAEELLETVLVATTWIELRIVLSMSLKMIIGVEDLLLWSLLLRSNHSFETVVCKPAESKRGGPVFKVEPVQKSSPSVKEERSVAKAPRYFFPNLFTKRAS
ncbi:hypothetical protein F2Q69_00052028 [Brassica cretica]|uniref:Uncharacterized protein n=1 Tax=Brassica cretica TaxID=69181 RepID=A0A8S9N9I0_BRACR|nr:hypothetical protein F2Q69_00052028 [Brassica cretica]